MADNIMDLFSMLGMNVSEEKQLPQDDKEWLSYTNLKQEIEHHMKAYYDADAPTISDYEYDQLMVRLRDMENHHPEWVDETSPTQKVGGHTKREAGVNVTHKVPMLSIRDVFSYEDVKEWLDEVWETDPNRAIFVEEKIDGLSMTLRYQAGKLVMAETRGDGYIGEDVTANAYCISDVPKNIRSSSEHDYLEVRGEVYMSDVNFRRYNARMEELGKKPAANARNLAAGTLRQLDTGIVAERGLSFFAFNVQDASGLYADIVSSQGYALGELRAMGFRPVQSYPCENAEDVFRAIEKIAQDRSTLPYGIDGAVLKIGSYSDRKKFPEGSKYAAGHIAYKYPPEEKEVEISDIEVGVGRTGKLSFTAVFKDPVELAGTSVSRATVHNMDYIHEKQISIGAKAICRKQGDIIPAIIRVTKPAGTIYERPTICPVCGSALVLEEGVADIFCTNPLCSAQVKNRILYFCSRDAMDIKFLGEEQISALCDQGYLQNYADIYSLKEKREELITKGVLGRDKNTDRILDAIERSKQNDAWRLLAGLGIRNVGKTLAKTLMRKFGGIEELAKAWTVTLLTCDDVGEITANAIRSFFANKEKQEILKRFADYGLNMVADSENVSAEFAGKVFVITGTLSQKREDFVSVIESHGGKVSGSVSKKTDYLLAGDAAGSKLSKAKELGVKILSESEFHALLN